MNIFWHLQHMLTVEPRSLWENEPTPFNLSLASLGQKKLLFSFSMNYSFNNQPHWNFGGHVYGWWWLAVDLFFISLFWKCGKVQFSIQNIFSIRPFYLVFYVMVIWNNPRLLWRPHTNSSCIFPHFKKINQILLIINSLNNDKQLNAE